MTVTAKALPFLAGAIFAAITLPLAAQTYPSKPMVLVSGASVGSGPDVAVRTVLAKISDALNQQIVVEPRRGAGGMEAYRAGAQAEPDGYKLTFANAGIITNRFLRKNWPIDAIKDYTPVLQVLDVAFMAGANAALPANNLRELIDYAKQYPGKVKFGTTGVGSGAHLVGESLNIMAGVKMVHVPYTGGNTALGLTDLLANRVQIYYGSLSSFEQHVKSGKLKLLTYANSKRHKAWPNVKTINEELPQYYNLVIWFGILGPAGLPRPIVDRWYTEGHKALSDAATVTKLEALGVVPAQDVTPDDFARRIRNDSENIRKVVASLGLKPR